jgi:hypothetical protein
MKSKFLLAASVLSGCYAFSEVEAVANDWMLRVETSSRVCHVQLKTAVPLGADFKGPFPDRKSTCTEASNQYDNTLSNQGKCWTYGQGAIDGCKKDGISLPPKSASNPRN